MREFLARGYAGTSMARIASAAEISRPALYQYFRDKDDVFASAFASVFEERAAAASAAVSSSATVGEALEGLLQRHDGDLWELVASSEFFDEIVAAKSPSVIAAVSGVLDGFWEDVAAWLVTVHPGPSAAAQGRRADWLAVLRWGPQGMRLDRPSVAVYRRRLSALARTVVADIDATG